MIENSLIITSFQRVIFRSLEAKEMSSRFNVSHKLELNYSSFQLLLEYRFKYHQ
jgi:hypothetical protein